MMKLSFIGIILIFCYVSATSQSCLPEGIGFGSQAQIDSFQINNPNCTEIEGNVVIAGDDITNLNGLSVLTSLGGNLEIAYNASLTNMTGLENLSFIEGDLDIGGVYVGNSSLTSLSGLENLDSIGGTLKVWENAALTSLTGLENLISINGDLIIGTEYFWHLTWHHGGNPSLTNLAGLEGLTSIGGELSIFGNDSLTSLAGLDNIDANSIETLYIYDNDSLSSCVVQSICDYISSPNGIIEIHRNAPGCNSPVEVASACGFVMPCLPYGNYFFHFQSEIDSFQFYYPGCTDLAGNLTINGDDISSLLGLSIINSIDGGLVIENNIALTTLTGLEGLTSVGGYLRIEENAALTKLTGLDNIDAYSILIWGLNINSNPLLSTCEVESICIYLAEVHGGYLEVIYDNAPGCNSPEEVLDSCEANSVNIDEQFITDKFVLYPNPANQELNISIEGHDIDKVSIYTLTGQQVLHERPGNGTIDISLLHPGMYIVEVTIENTRLRQKLLIE